MKAQQRMIWKWLKGVILESLEENQEKVAIFAQRKNCDALVLFVCIMESRKCYEKTSVLKRKCEFNFSLQFLFATIYAPIIM
jgi:hypothetical protein